MVLQEANAIGTAYLRADFLPEKKMVKSKELLKQYVDFRLEARDRVTKETGVLIDNSEEL